MQEDENFTNQAAVENVAELFDKVMQGPLAEQIPSVMSMTQSLRPDIFSAVMAAGKPILFEGALPISVKQMIIMIIATRRNCRFCSNVHKAMLEAMGIDDALIQSCIDDPEMKLVPPMYRQILNFAMDAALDPSNIDDAQFSRLEDSGLNQQEILEVAMVASFANFLVTWTDIPASIGD